LNESHQADRRNGIALDCRAHRARTLLPVAAQKARPCGRTMAVTRGYRSTNRGCGAYRLLAGGINRALLAHVRDLAALAMDPTLALIRHIKVYLVPLIASARLIWHGTVAKAR
jgi:hypothetical protein